MRKAKNRDELAAQMGRTNVDFEGTLFNLGTDIDLKDPTKYAVYISQGGLGLPDRDYYLKPDFAKQKGAYEGHAAKLLGLVGWKNAEQAAKDVVAFETKVAEASWTKTEQRDLSKVYNPMTIRSCEICAEFRVGALSQESKLGELKRIIVAENSAFPKSPRSTCRLPSTRSRHGRRFHSGQAAYYLSQPFADAYFEMHNKTLSGQQAQAVRWKRGVHAVSGGDYGAGDRADTFGNLGWAVGQLYTAKYFPPQSKAKIEELVANLKAAYHARIEKLDWMSAPTKGEALKKLDTYTIKVGYPDHHATTRMSSFATMILIGNVTRAAAAGWGFFVAV